MNCRGTATRQRIVKEYNVKPVAHIQLLAGQTKHSVMQKLLSGKSITYLTQKEKVMEK